MSIDFGEITKYFGERGFGFVSRTFLVGGQAGVFFHIKAIKRSNPKLAERLNEASSTKAIYFWYDTEETNKGECVRSALSSSAAVDEIGSSLSAYIKKLEEIWTDVAKPKPSWLDAITADLLGSDRIQELDSARSRLESEKRRLDEEERAAKRAIEIAERNRLIEEIDAQKRLEDREFRDLVAEIRALGFSQTSQVSNYIVRNRLGEKYRNISGILEMERDGTSWSFTGGFPPAIYARLCHELGLGNRGTTARPVGFKSFRDLDSA